MVGTSNNSVPEIPIDSIKYIYIYIAMTNRESCTRWRFPVVNFALLPIQLLPTVYIYIP